MPSLLFACQKTFHDLYIHAQMLFQGFSGVLTKKEGKHPVKTVLA
jgi:hypothetical protein